MRTLDFVQQQLSQPGVDLEHVSRCCDISVRTLQMIKAGVATNTGVDRVDRIARHFGWRLKPVRLTGRGAAQDAALRDTKAA